MEVILTLTLSAICECNYDGLYPIFGVTLARMVCGTTQAARPIKVSDGTLMGVGVMGCLIWPQSRDEYYD